MPSDRGYRFPSEVISHAVWLYHRFSLSFRDVEDLLAERGITVTYETIRQWCRTFGLEYARRRRLCLPKTSSPHYVHWAVLAPFAVDQAACLRADGEQRVDSSASSDSVG